MNRTHRWILGGALLLALALPASAQTLRFGVLGDVDSLPYLVARDEGLFARHGVDVTLVPFQSPVERDAAFQAGAVDGIVGDVLGVALAVQNGFSVAIVAATDGRYQLLGAPGTTLTPQTLGVLAGVPVAGSRNTVIHYFVGRVLGRAGLSPAQVNLLAVPKMPVRLEMLLAGQVAAASLPEPLATAARARGAVVLADSAGLDMDPGVVVFQKQVAADKRAAVAALLAAGAEAGAKINAQPDSYRDYLVQKVGFPSAVRDSFTFVAYRPSRLPSDASVASILGWMKDQGLLKADLAPADLVDRRVLAGR